jgi:hypothetical protein
VKHHEGLISLALARPLQVAVSSCVYDFSLQARAYPQQNTYQVYFLEAPASSSVPKFIHFEKALWDRDKKGELVKSGGGLNIVNRDPVCWLYIPLAQAIPYPGDPSKVILFLHDFVTDTENTMYSPLHAALVDKEILENTSRARLIEQLFGRDRPATLKLPSSQLVQLAVFLDVSLYASGKIDRTRLALKEMIQAFQAGDNSRNISISLVPFAFRAMPFVPLTQVSKFPLEEIGKLRPLAGGKMEVQNGPKGPEVVQVKFGHCNIADALDYAVHKVFSDETGPEVKRYILLLSSGLPYLSTHKIGSLEEKMAMLQQEQSRVKKIGQGCSGITILTRYLGSEEAAYANTRIFDEIGVSAEDVANYGLDTPEKFFGSFSSYQRVEPLGIWPSLLKEFGGGPNTADLLISDYSLQAEWSAEVAQKIDRESKLIKYNLYAVCEDSPKSKRSAVGMFMMENNKRIVMFDLFASPQMFQTAMSDLAGNYADYAVEQSYHPVAQYIAQPEKPGMTELLSHLKTLLKDMDKKDSPHVIRGNRKLPYEFRQLWAAKRIGFYFALGNDIFHIHMLCRKD